MIINGESEFWTVGLTKVVVANSSIANLLHTLHAYFIPSDLQILEGGKEKVVQEAGEETLKEDGKSKQGVRREKSKEGGSTNIVGRQHILRLKDRC